MHSSCRVLGVPFLRLPGKALPFSSSRPSGAVNVFKSRCTNLRAVGKKTQQKLCHRKPACSRATTIEGQSLTSGYHELGVAVFNPCAALKERQQSCKRELFSLQKSSDNPEWKCEDIPKSAHFWDASPLPSVQTRHTAARLSGSRSHSPKWEFS